MYFTNNYQCKYITRTKNKLIFLNLMKSSYQLLEDTNEHQCHFAMVKEIPVTYPVTNFLMVIFADRYCFMHINQQEVSYQVRNKLCH